MTPKEYAAKYGISRSGLYKALYSGRIDGTLTDGRWDVDDVPPPPLRSRSAASSLCGLTDYEISLIWLNGTICDNSLLIRSKDEFLPHYFSQRIPGSYWSKEGGERYLFKSSSMKLCASLREMGFTGRKDATLSPPTVNPVDFAAALVESRCSFTRALYHCRNHRSYYTPSVSFCASYPIMEHFVSTLAETGVIPPRKLSPAANQTSATLKITSRPQMEAIYSLLSPIGQNTAFWAELLTWAQHPNMPH